MFTTLLQPFKIPFKKKKEKVLLNVKTNIVNIYEYLLPLSNFNSFDWMIKGERLIDEKLLLFLSQY